jgi:hypothetical protein
MQFVAPESGHGAIRVVGRGPLSNAYAIAADDRPGRCREPDHDATAGPGVV